MDGFDDVIAEFLVESHENLDGLDRDLLALEEHPDDTSALGSAFRTIHTIKGTCGFLGFGNLEGVTHVGENLLSRLRDGELRLDAEITTALLEMVDAVRAMLSEIEASGTDGTETYPELVARLRELQEPRPAVTTDAPAAEEIEAAEEVEAEAPAEAPAGAATGGPVASPIGELLVEAGAVAPDAVALALAEQTLGDSRRIGEVLVAHGAASPGDVESAVLAQLLADRAPTEGGGADEVGAPSEDKPVDGRSGISESTIRVDVGVLDRLMNLVGELVLSRNNMLQHLDSRSDPAMAAAAQQLDLVTGELQECVMKTRMQPIGTVWSRFTRVVRDLSVQFDKQVRIEMEGEDTELDKTILEAIKDPLTHVVRNTVDHGIEAPDVRTAAGKSPEGVLRLRARHEGGQVVIEIADDGAGIDTLKVRAKAVARGLITEQRAREMSEREALHLIFRPGFSTAEKITNVSGRGVGMDVVKTNIERIGGTVDVESEQGRGTTLRIRIPLTLAIVPALMVQCCDDQYAIPQIEVRELVRVGGEEGSGDVEMLHNAPVYRLRGKLLPLVSLREQFEFPAAGDGEAQTIAVISTDGVDWGLVMDGVTTTEEIVVKPLGNLLSSVPTFSGATIMGNGRIALILDVAGIARRSHVVATGESVNELVDEAEATTTVTTAKVLVVENGEEHIGIDLGQVSRLEQLEASALERSGSMEVIQYRGGILPLVRLGFGTDSTELTAVVFERDGRAAGVIVDRIVDIADAELPDGADRPMGTTVVRGRVTRMIEVDNLLEPVLEWAQRDLVGVGA